MITAIVAVSMLAIHGLGFIAPSVSFIIQPYSCRDPVGQIEANRAGNWYHRRFVYASVFLRGNKPKGSS